MSYIDLINGTLRPRSGNGPRVLDLFAGCGGLSLGFEAAGFEVVGYEADAACCETYRRNLRGPCHREFLTERTAFPAADVVVGGPPCQPFSVIGRQKGKADERNGLPAFVSAVRRLDPDVWMFENVRGLLYRSKAYLDEVVQELRALDYRVEIRLLNAVDYGVPQNRERLIVVGHRGEYRYPAKAARRVAAGEAIGDTAALVPPESKFLTRSMDEYIARYEAKSCCINPRDLYLDRPARTLTCRNLAGATSDMQRVRLPDGRRRRLLIGEAKRLQSFPDWFEVCGGPEEAFNQIGNAVPPLFAHRLAESVLECLRSGVRRGREEIRTTNAVPEQGVLL